MDISHSQTRKSLEQQMQNYDDANQSCVQRMARNMIASIIFLCVPASSYAGGSFSVDVEFASIKEQIPGLWASLVNSFELARSGSANMIGSNVNERLGHRRVGPYCLIGKPKGQEGADDLLFCFNTEYLWLDKKGNTSDLQNAYDVKEKFVSLEITLLKQGAR